MGEEKPVLRRRGGGKEAETRWQRDGNCGDAVPPNRVGN